MAHPDEELFLDEIETVTFLAVLATGIVLVVLGHLTAGGLTTACAALGALYGVSQHFRQGYGNRQQLADPPSQALEEQDLNDQI